MNGPLMVAFVPAWYCPNADLTLMWEPGLLGWQLRRGIEVLGTLDGYPVSAPANTSREALAWASTVAGSQQWTQRPARSSAFHTHHTPQDTCPNR